jgi:hypothetical protein
MTTGSNTKRANTFVLVVHFSQKQIFNWLALFLIYNATYRLAKNFFGYAKCFLRAAKLLSRNAKFCKIGSNVHFQECKIFHLYFIARQRFQNRIMCKTYYPIQHAHSVVKFKYALGKIPPLIVL